METKMKNKKYAIAIHGGAGTILKSTMTPEKELAYKAALSDAIEAGENILSKDGTSLMAVQFAIASLENNILFNAGKGAVFTHKGNHELDASIMCGKTLNAGAVAGVQGVKNPINLATDIMLHSDHVLLCGLGAAEFAVSRGYEIVPNNYFYTEQRYQQWQEALKDDKVQLDHTVSKDEKKFGTVGAVAIDCHGNLAAGTSTGGMTNKKYGRAGDSPLIGCGTYANDLACAISCTGHGEYFIRSVVAYDVFCLMYYKGLSLQQACDEVVKNKLVKMGGEGGLIAIDNKGNICLPFNSEGMYRASKMEGDNIQIGIYSEME
jgi:beta-aspartyl-peptidase (threonine type)